MILLLAPCAAFAWLSPDHMATGAIAYDALERSDPAAVAAIVSLEEAHPDRVRSNGCSAEARLALAGYRIAAVLYGLR